MADIRFAVHRRSDLHDAAEVVPVVDDDELTDLVHRFERAAGMEKGEVCYGGLIPSNFRFGPLGKHFLAAEGAFVNDRGQVPLLGCVCGEWGCWPLLAKVTVDDDEVVWSEFAQPYRPERDYSGFGPFRFARAAYEQALGDMERALRNEE